MDNVYQQHFGLAQPPFNITPDPSFFYMSTSHREGLAQLSYGIKARKGFVVLTGEVGTGKTTIIHALLNELKEGTHTALIFSTIVGPLDLLRYVCEEFRLIEPNQPRSDIHDYLFLLNNFFLEQYRLGANCVLIIDEAQNLSAEVLESIRLLSNFETARDKLLQILLVGQPELAVRLNSQELRQLKQRVTLRHHLRPFSLNECQEYVANRLQVAGGDPNIFTATALKALYLYSSGIPRLINVLGDNALLTAYALGKSEVEDYLVREVADDLNLTQGMPLLYATKSSSENGANRVHSRQIAMGPTEPVNSKSSGGIEQLQVVNRFSKTAAYEDSVPSRFFDALNQDLVEAIGPMAKLILLDHIRLCGGSKESFPKKKLKSLLDSLSREIFDSTMKSQFQKAMSERIRGL